jgi:hypothetical protein
VESGAKQLKKGQYIMAQGDTEYMTLLLGIFTPVAQHTKESIPQVSNSRHLWLGRKLVPNFGSF